MGTRGKVLPGEEGHPVRQRCVVRDGRLVKGGFLIRNLIPSLMFIAHRSAEESRLTAKRLVHWFMYGCIFALVPFIVSVSLHALAGKLDIDAVASSPEILFFALMVSATALRDLSGIAASLDGKDAIFDLLRSVLLLGAMGSAIFYGSLLHDSIIGPGSADFRLRLLWVAIGMAIVLFLLGTVVEILIGRIEGGK